MCCAILDLYTIGELYIKYKKRVKRGQAALKSVSVSIVSYNNAHDLCGVLDSLFSATKGVDLTVYVVDNHSADDTCETVSKRYPQVQLLRMEDNLGFGAAHNRVLPLLTSDYHAVINPDITFSTDVLASLVAYLEEDSQAVLATPLILNCDGTPQAVPRVLPKHRYMFAGQLERFGGAFKRWRDEYTRRGETFEAPDEIEFCTGCFMLWRTETLKELGGFDERFFMYLEDADLSRRAAKYGKLMLVPTVAVTHVWEKASGKSAKFLKIHLQSMHRYFAKWRKQV